jgi:hypothetical protein
VTPLPNVPNVVKTSVRMTVGEDLRCQSAQHWHVSLATPTTSDLGDFALAVAVAWTADLRALCHSDVVMTEVEALACGDMSQPPGIWTGTSAGSRAGSFLPADNCVVVNYHIARRYRGGHPRGYWPFGVQGDLQDAQKWAGTFEGAVQSAYTAWQSAVLGYTTAFSVNEQVSVGYFQGGTWETPSGGGRPIWRPTKKIPPYVDAVTAASVRQIVGSQKRRLSV